MAQCVATIWGTNQCENEAERGYKFCAEHKTRKKALEEREEKSLSSVIESSNVLSPNFANGETPEPKHDVQVKQTEGELIKAQPRNIYEKTNDVLERALNWEEQTWQKVQALNPDDWQKEDKAGVPQLNPVIGVNERAQDRTIRAVTAIAKLNIDAQSVNINKMVQEVVKSVVTKSLTRAEVEPQTIEQVRRFMAEEFERVASEAS